MDSLIIGIDPGKSGGIAFLIDVGNAYAVPMPPSYRDILTIIEDWPAPQNVQALIEAVTPFPTFGASANFRLGESFGSLKMALAALEIPFTTVPPIRWQKSFRLPTKSQAGSQTKKKNAHKARAQELFPKLNVTLATCDALLIAEYGRANGLGGHNGS